MIPNSTNLFFELKIMKILFGIVKKGPNKINKTLDFKQTYYPLPICIRQSFAFFMETLQARWHSTYPTETINVCFFFYQADLLKIHKSQDSRGRQRPIPLATTSQTVSC